METAWNKDNAGTELFPNSESLAIQNMNEDDMMNMAIAESIVTAQLEQFRLDEDQKTTSASSHMKSDNDSRGTAHCTFPDSQESEKNSTVQLDAVPAHDNNNNNAKSKNQSVPETKKFVLKPILKTGVEKLVDQKVKRQAGSTSTESCTNPRECTKEKTESLNLSNKNYETTTDVKKSPSLCPGRFIDKYGRVDGYNNRHLFMGKGGRMKEYEYMRKHGYLDNNANKKTSAKTEEKRSVGTKPQSRVESDKKYNSADSKKCHSVTVTRTQSFNPEYNRRKLLVKPQEEFLESLTDRPVTRFLPNVRTSSSSAGRTSNYHTTKILSSNVHDAKTPTTSPTQSTSGTVSKRSSSHPDVRKSVPNSVKHTNVEPYKPPSRTSSYGTRLSTERNKENQPYSHGFKRDSNVFRRSVNSTEHRHANERVQTDDYKKNVTSSIASRGYKTSQSSSRITKSNSQPVSSTTTVSSSNANKTSRPSLSTGNSTQAVEPVDSSDSKGPITCTKTSVANDQNPSTSQSAHETETPPIIKSSSEENDNSKSNIDNKPVVNTTVVKSVKFSDCIQEIRVTDTSIVQSIPSVSTQKNEGSTNPFFSELQTAPKTNGQISANTGPPECTTYPNDTPSMKVHNPNQESHFLDVLQHSASQNPYSSNTSNSNVTSGNNTQYYPNTSGIYLNHHNIARAVSTRTTDSTNASHTTPVPSISSYNVQNSNYSQAEPSSILLASSQTTVIPPPGFHNHPIMSEQNQWNVLTPDTLYFGNAMTTGHPVNMHIPNSRVICNDFNNIQQTGYVQHPLSYAPVCMQNWHHPLVQCAPSTIQNIQYTNCNAYPHHMISSNNPGIPLNCPAPSPTQNNPYKHYHQYEQMEYESLTKHEHYMGNVQGCAIRSKSTKAQDCIGDFQLRSNHYNRPANDYRSYPQDTQSMMHSSYPTSMDPVGRRNQWQSQMQQTYVPRGGINQDYQGVSEGLPKYQNTQDLGERRDNDAKTEPESIPPIISPRECMYYGINFQRKIENSNPNLRNVTKSTEYVHSTTVQEHGVPQFPKYPYKTLGRGIRTSMESQN